MKAEERLVVRLRRLERELNTDHRRECSAFAALRGILWQYDADKFIDSFEVERQRKEVEDCSCRGKVLTDCPIPGGEKWGG